jgi:hypothetical protein
VSAHQLFLALDRAPESMAPLRVGGTVKRDAFTAAFPQLVRRLSLGRATAVATGWTAGQAKKAVECGQVGPSVEARVEDCALLFPEQARVGPFQLVARSAKGREVWLDGTRQLLWSSAGPAATQALAALQCSDEPKVAGAWFLPSAEQLERALEDGLPGGGWQLLWSRDVEQGHKYATPGVAVGAGRRVEEEPGVRLASRCVARP